MVYFAFESDAWLLSSWQLKKGGGKEYYLEWYFYAGQLSQHLKPANALSADLAIQ